MKFIDIIFVLLSLNLMASCVSKTQAAQNKWFKLIAGTISELGGANAEEDAQLLQCIPAEFKGADDSESTEIQAAVDANSPFKNSIRCCRKSNFYHVPIQKRN